MTEPRLPKFGPQATPYIYRDAEGNAVFLVVRIDKPEGKTFAQYHVENNKWVLGGLQGKPLWNLSLIVGTPDAKVLVVEGEKAAKAAQNYLPDGWIVTTWAGGSNSISGTDWTPLQNRRVAIWPDWDLKKYQNGHAKAGQIMPQDKQPGMMAAQRVVTAVAGAVIIPLPVAVMASNFNGWDLADELPQGLTAEQVTAIIGNTFAEKSREPPPEEKQTIIPPVTLLRELAKLGPLDYGMRRKDAAKSLGVPVSALDKAVAREKPKVAVLGSGTEIQWVTSIDGNIQPIFANAVALLRANGKRWPLKFDEFSQRPFLGDAALIDSNLLAIAEWVQQNGVTAAKKIIDEAAIHVANERKFHEIRDWLDSLEWDEISRNEMLLIDHAGAKNTPLNRAVTSRWLIQACARIYEPGCQADATLILEGRQDLGKSSLFRALFGDRWFTDHLPNLDNKDAMLQLLGIWCVEVAELATLDRSENSKIKQFLTSRVDRFRMPWDKLAADHPRQSVFSGTVNPGAGGYLKDETGGRRFWPVTVDHIDVAQIFNNREQIWAEAVARYKAQEIWHLGGGDLAEAARDAQDDRYVGDPWLEAIEKFLGQKTETSHETLLVDCLGIHAKADWKQSDYNRITRCLAHLKWERKQRRDNGKRRWVYTRPQTLDLIPTPDENEREYEIEEIEGG